MKVLHLTLEKKWFYMIASGEKKEEYREIKPYWQKRFSEKDFDVIEFKNGYSKNAPCMQVEVKELLIGLGIIKWGAPERIPVYIFKLGEVRVTTNCDKEKSI